MPAPELLTPLGLAMLEQLPPQLRGSIDYMAAIHAMARELETLEAAIEQVRAQFNPATADLLLNAWEFETKLPVGGLPGQTVQQRRDTVLARLRKPFSGEGRQWEETITAMVGPGWTYLEHDPNPLTMGIVNGSFEHDALGAAPAGWHALVLPSGAALQTFAVGNGWAKEGTRALELAATGVTVGAAITTYTLAPIALNGSTECSIRGSYSANNAASLPLMQVDFLNAGGATIQTLSYGGVAGGAGVIEAEGIAVPTGAVSFVVALAVSNGSAATATVSGWFDGITAFPTATLPVATYVDGDFVGWRWSGTPGNSVSTVDTPPDGVVRVIIGWATGTPQFANALREIRDITDAHLQVEVLSSAPFLLDESQLDVSEFGA